MVKKEELEQSLKLALTMARVIEFQPGSRYLVVIELPDLNLAEIARLSAEVNGQLKLFFAGVTYRVLVIAGKLDIYEIKPMGD